LIWIGIVAIPGVRYVMATIRRQPSQGSQIKRIARLADLPVGRPVSVAMTGSRSDAWTTYPDEPLGEIWLIRRDSQIDDPSKSRIDAFSSVCPHLRCRIQMDAPQKQFVCPCHRGAFDLEGKPISKEQLGHHNPAPGPLEMFAVKVVPDDKNDWWVEIEYPT
jgi:menaquinol-cytochrome c reductase iron-sulfur subunit